MSCGAGQRQRGYWCQIEDHVIAKSYCYPVRPPIHREDCHMDDCPQWHATQWGQVYPPSPLQKKKKKKTELNHVYIFSSATSLDGHCTTSLSSVASLCLFMLLHLFLRIYFMPLCHPSLSSFLPDSSFRIFYFFDSGCRALLFSA